MGHPQTSDDELSALRQQALDATAPLLTRLQAAVRRMEKISDLLELEVTEYRSQRPQGESGD